jgi:sulfotransferase
MNRGFVGGALGGLRQAWFSEHAAQLVAVRYESLAESPDQTVAALYNLIGEEPYEHDYNEVSYEASDFDAELGLPGFHRIHGPIRRNARTSILPTDLFERYNQCFWDEPEQNPRGVQIL